MLPHCGGFSVITVSSRPLCFHTSVFTHLIVGMFRMFVSDTTVCPMQTVWQRKCVCVRANVKAMWAYVRVCVYLCM